MAISSGSTGVAHQSSQYRYMLEDWLLIDAICGGTRTMRMSGETYMPKRTAETTEDHQIRIQNATLYPAFIETSSSMTGRVFAMPMTLNNDIPSWIKDEVLNDVDRLGRDVHTFSREAFNEALDFGMTHILVDSPTTNGERMTVEQQKKGGFRPYWVKVHPRNVLGWREEDGKLTQLRVQFSEVQDEGDWATFAVDQIRVYDLIDGSVHVTVWEQMMDNDASLAEKKEPQWESKEEYDLALDTIPFITFYTKRTGYMMSQPPLRELAFLNAKHWRLESELDTLIETAMVPILCTVGVTNTTKMTLGAKQFVKLPTGGDMKYVEHTGASIQSGQSKLKDVEEQMRQAGASLLKPIVGARTGRTASEVKDEVARDNSQLGDMVLQFQNTMAKLLDLTGLFRNEKKGGTVLLHPNLDPEVNPGTTVDALDKLRQGGVLSRETIFEHVQGIGLIREGITWEEETARIKKDLPLVADTTGQPFSTVPVPGPTGASGAAGGTGASGPAPAPGPTGAKK